MKKILMLLIMASFVLSACALFPSEDSGRITGEIIEILPSDNDVVIEISEDGDIEFETEEEVMEDEEVMDEYSDILVRIEGIEGDLISLKPDAFDPDGDTIIYTFTEPFDENGEWRTVEGDEGKYVVTVTASDGRLSTSEDVLVILNPTNKAPIITCEDELTYEEGDLVEIECDVRDPEGQDFTVEYSGWINTTTYQTTFEDSGNYEVVVSASDGDRTTTKTIDITVENVNRPPVVEDIKKIVLEETETIMVEVVASDPDGDRLTFKYSEQLDTDGEWKTDYGDAGTYDAFVVVSDGQSSLKKEFEILVTLKNTAPNLDFIPSIIADEGETIALSINAYDREGDDLTITITGFFDTETYIVTYDDAGQHEVTVSVNDGELITSQKVEIIINNVNRAPVFKIPA